MASYGALVSNSSRIYHRHGMRLRLVLWRADLCFITTSRHSIFVRHAASEPQAKRDGQHQHPLARRHMRNEVISRVGSRLRHAPGSALWAKASALAAEGAQLVVPTVIATQPKKAVRQDATFEKGVERVLDDPRKPRSGADPGVRNEAGHMLLHRSIRRSLLGAVAVVAERCAIGRPLGCRPLFCTRGARRCESAYSKAAGFASIALCAAERRVPSADGRPSGASLGSDRRLQGDKFKAA